MKMMAKQFTWTDKEKEKYYKAAEKMLDGIDGVEIDRERFGVRANEMAIVYIKRISAKEKGKINQLRKLKNFRVIEGKYIGEYGYVTTNIYVDGCFEIQMGGKKNVPEKKK